MKEEKVNMERHENWKVDIISFKLFDFCLWPIWNYRQTFIKWHSIEIINTEVIISITYFWFIQ